MSIFIKRDDQKPELLKISSFQKESDLQSQLADNLKIIPLEDLGQGLEFTLVSREFCVDGGRIDILAVDQTGQLYILETKLKTNSDRRQVVSQVIDYASNLWRNWSKDVDSFLKTTDLLAKVKQDGRLDEESILDFLAKLSETLQSGSFKLIVLMDKIDQHLKNLISFINSSSKFSVYAVELLYYQKNDLEIIIPKLYGAETGSSAKHRSSKYEDSTPDQFWQDVKDKGLIDVGLVRQVLTTLSSIVESDGQIKYRFSKQYQHHYVVLKVDNKYYPWILYPNGKLRIYCGANTVYHSINKKVLEILAKNERLGKTSTDIEKQHTVFYLDEFSKEDVIYLCGLYNTANYD